MAKKQIGDVDYNVEFNDSVLSTKTWNNPRYDGCKTETQILNKFTPGDTTYGKTPAVQEYSRNIYIGKTIIGYLDDLYLDLAHTQPKTGSFNTGKYTGLSGWSTTIIEKSYTVNEDDSLEANQKFETAVTESSDSLGRIFKNDFLVGTKCNIIDYSTTTSNLQAQYTVQYNNGLLGKIAEAVATREDFGISVTTNTSGPKGSNKFTFAPGAGPFDSDQAFYIQPFSSFNTFWTDISGSGYGNNFQTGSAIQTFFQMVSENQTNDRDRYAIKFFSTSSPETAYVSNTSGPVSRLLYELSDITIGSSNANVSALVKETNTQFLQQVQGPGPLPMTSFITSSLDNNTNFVLYYINESNNVLMVDLPRTRDLPQGINEFIILPENIHPYIKDNINYFVNQIGLVSSNENFTINPRNRQLS